LIITARDVCKSVPTGEGELTILDSVDLDLAPGEVLAIVGPSGSGKSTLLGVLAGLDSASSGSVLLQDQPLHTLDEDGRAAVRAGSVGFVFQSFQLLPGLSALENVMLPLELANIADAKSRAHQQLAAVGLEDRLGHLPAQLSGGEQQRVAVATNAGTLGRDFGLAMRQLRREFRLSEYLVLIFALILSVAAVTSVGFFANRVERAMAGQAATPCEIEPLKIHCKLQM